MQPTDEQIKVAAYRVQQVHEQAIDEVIIAAVRAGYALAVKPAEPKPPDLTEEIF